MKRRNLVPANNEAQTCRWLNEMFGSLMDQEATLVASSRALTDDDHGELLECTNTVTLTVPTGLRAGFSCAIICNGTTSIASSGGTLLNGAPSTLSRAASTNPIVTIVGRKSASNSYVVTGS